MANNFVTNQMIAKAAVKVLDNELVAASKVFRGYEAEFASTANGYEKGATVTIKKPPQFQVRDGDVAQAQDITEGTTSITVNKKKGVDLKISSTDRTLSIGELSERVIKPAMVSLANQVEMGSRTNGTVNGANQNVTYSQVLSNGVAVKDFGGQLLNVAGVGANATISAGEVFTVAGVYAANHVTKQPLNFLRQFTVMSAAVADSSGNVVLQIHPAMIAPAALPAGAFTTVSAAPASGAAVSWMGNASSQYTQNIMAHKSAFALAVVPLVKPDGAVVCERESYKGLSVRLISYYDGTNDISNMRLDVLYGVKAVDPRLAVRLNG